MLYKWLYKALLKALYKALLKVLLKAFKETCSMIEDIVDIYWSLIGSI